MKFKNDESVDDRAAIMGWNDRASTSNVARIKDAVISMGNIAISNEHLGHKLDKKQKSTTTTPS